jgi:hypothetical protein
MATGPRADAGAWSDWRGGYAAARRMARSSPHCSLSLRVPNRRSATSAIGPSRSRHVAIATPCEKYDADVMVVRPTLCVACGFRASAQLMLYPAGGQAAP